MAAMRNLAIGVLAEQDRSMPPRSGSTAATPADPWRPFESGSDQTEITQERQSLQVDLVTQPGPERAMIRPASWRGGCGTGQPAAGPADAAAGSAAGLVGSMRK
jgi:hypothetical protein